MDEPPSGGHLEDPPTRKPKEETRGGHLEDPSTRRPEEPLSAWLDRLHLGVYAAALGARGFLHPADLAGCDDIELARLGVALPGHRKRILSRLHRPCVEVVAAAVEGSLEEPGSLVDGQRRRMERGTDCADGTDDGSGDSDDGGGNGDNGGDDGSERRESTEVPAPGRGLAAWSVEPALPVLTVPPHPSLRKCQLDQDNGVSDDAATTAASASFPMTPTELGQRAPARPSAQYLAATSDSAGAQRQLPLSTHPFFLGASTAATRLSPRLMRSLTVGDETSPHLLQERRQQQQFQQELQQEFQQGHQQGRQEELQQGHQQELKQDLEQPELLHQQQREKRELKRRSSAPPAPVSTALPLALPAAPANPLLKGYLYKTASSTRQFTERRARDEFSRRRCELRDGELRYFDGERSARAPNGRVLCAQLCSLSTRGAANPTLHGFEHTFELCVCGEASDGERLYLFGADSEETCRTWVLQLARCCSPPPPEPLLALPWERLGRLAFRDGYCSRRWRSGWFALVRCSLFFLADGNTHDSDPHDGDPNDGDPNDGDPNDGDPNNRDPNNGDSNGGAGDGVSLQNGGAAQRQDDETSSAQTEPAGQLARRGSGCGGEEEEEEAAVPAPASVDRGVEDGRGAVRLDAVSLNKLHELSVMTPSEDGDKREVLLLVERRRMLCVRTPGRLCAAGWLFALRTASKGHSDELSQVQLTDGDVPVIVNKCLAYVTQHGLAWEGVYRKTGVNSRIAALLGELRGDARAVRLGDAAYHVDDVTTALRRFLREARPSVFTAQLRQRWVDTAGVSSEAAMLCGYRDLVSALPPVNRATLTEIVAHLHCVQSYSSLNHMTAHNLSIVFTPSLFHSEGKGAGEGLVVEHLITHYPTLFNVSEEQLKARQQETDLIVQMTNSSFLTKERAGDMIIEVYLLHKDNDSCLSLQVSAAMTALDLVEEVLAMRPAAEAVGAPSPTVGGGPSPLPWAVFEVIAGGEMERALHYRERVLDTVLRWHRHADFHTHYLMVQPHRTVPAMQHYLGRCGGAVRWEGAVRIREEATWLGDLLPVSRFHEKFLVLSAGVVTVYRDPRASRAEREWLLSSLSVYQGVRKKLKPPSQFAVTLFHGQQQWYLCFDNEEDFLQWHASILHTQYEGDVWGAVRAGGASPAERGPAVRRVGKRSLIPLRGDQRDIRKSLAAISAAAGATGAADTVTAGANATATATSTNTITAVADATGATTAVTVEGACGTSEA